MKHELSTLIEAAQAENSEIELALGWLRFEALRTVDPAKFADFYRRSLAGERFDDLVDELVLNGE